MTATASGFMIRFIAARISACEGRKGAGFGFRSSRMRTSTAVAPFFRAKIGFRSISAISGKSAISFDTFWMIAARACRSTGSAPRTPLRISAPWMPCSIDSASDFEAGARRKVTSFITSTSTPPRPKATSLPKLGSVTAPTRTSCAPSEESIFCTWTPAIRAFLL